MPTTNNNTMNTKDNSSDSSAQQMPIISYASLLKGAAAAATTVNNSLVENCYSCPTEAANCNAQVQTAQANTASHQVNSRDTSVEANNFG